MINISRATAKGLFTAETQRAQRQRGEEIEFLRLGSERVSTNRALLFHHYPPLLPFAFFLLPYAAAVRSSFPYTRAFHYGFRDKAIARLLGFDYIARRSGSKS
jgi:hypothetical protein